MIWLSTLDFLLAGLNVALAVGIGGRLSPLNWGVAVFCFGVGLAVLHDK